VINVHFLNAQGYVAWLSKVTGKPYRLLTEAEYEYAARAGAQTPYPWGPEIGARNTNCKGCGSKWDASNTAPVGSFAPNSFGLHEMVGNVGTWVEDCYHPNYDNAPTDGSAWTTGEDCSSSVFSVPHRRITRGGSWLDHPEEVRSAHRGWLLSNIITNYIGFRVARTLLSP
jgi:formylglycine-generating enzyme required for sulfatase activity